MVDPEVVEWMLDSDPSLRWQVERDLADRPDEVWQRTRARVAREGFGAQLLALQDDDGQWAGGAFFPHQDLLTAEDREGPGQPWVATTPTLSLLRQWGVPAEALRGTVEKLDRNSRWEYDDLAYWAGEVDVCINAETLATGAWLGADVSGLAQWFIEHRLPDGGWNCDWVEGSTRSSFHSTLNALRGLLAHEQLTGGSSELRAARHAGEEYLLERRLMHRLSTGERVGSFIDDFTYPFRWFYSALNAVDYFLEAARFDEVDPDARISEAIEIVRARRESDGRWRSDGRYRGRVWFEIDVAEGEPSKWVTFYATRALRRWDAALR